MAKKTLNIITPAYNRAGTLPGLYASLKRQTDTDFLWTIVDDGSRDDTNRVVEGFIKEKVIPIAYLYKENGGKHTALNLAIQKSKEDLIFIVDSDDLLTEDAVSTIRAYADKYEPLRIKEKLCGFSFLRAYPDGKINDRAFPQNEKIGTYCSQRINAGIAGDKAEVYYTEILKKYPFRVFPKEKFLPEDAVWMQMSGPYRMVHINHVIYISDYLKGGLTRTGRAMKVYSPFGMMYRSCVYLDDTGVNHVNLKTRTKMQILYHVYRFFAVEYVRDGRLTEKTFKANDAECKVRKNVLYYITKFPSWLVYRKWRKTYGESTPLKTEEL